MKYFKTTLESRFIEREWTNTLINNGQFEKKQIFFQRSYTSSIRCNIICWFGHTGIGFQVTRSIVWAAMSHVFAANKVIYLGVLTTEPLKYREFQMQNAKTKLRQPIGQTFFPTFPKEFSHFLQTFIGKTQKKSLILWKVGWTPCLFSSWTIC